MIQPSTLRFLQGLNANNNKPWFDEHRHEYLSAKDNFKETVEILLAKMSTLEPALSTQEAKDCIFRIFRDVRFSKDKTPYKSHFGAYFSKGGRKFPGAGYYLHIEPGKSFAAAGLWMPEGQLLKAVRQEIDYNFDEFNTILNEKKFKKLFGKLEGERLKSLPQGYGADNPAIEYLKLKSFTVSHKLTDDEVLAETFATKLVDIFKVVRNLVEFLNRAVE